MALNIFSLLQEAKDVASSGAATIFGVEVGIVTNVQDPDSAGRVKLSLPRLPGGPETGWVRVAQPAAGDNRGFYWIPDVHDEVVVAFERGDPSKPFVIRTLRTG